MNGRNLKPFKKGEPSTEEAKRRGRLGGLKSAETRRRKRAIIEFAEAYLRVLDNAE